MPNLLFKDVKWLNYNSVIPSIIMIKTDSSNSDLQLESDAAALFDCPDIKPEQCILRPDAKVKLD